MRKTIRMLAAIGMVTYMGMFVGVAGATHDGTGVCIAPASGFSLTDLFGSPLPPEVDALLHGSVGFRGVVVDAGEIIVDDSTVPPTVTYDPTVPPTVTVYNDPLTYENACCAALGEEPECFQPVE